MKRFFFALIFLLSLLILCSFLAMQISAKSDELQKEVKRLYYFAEQGDNENAKDYFDRIKQKWGKSDLLFRTVAGRDHCDSIEITLSHGLVLLNANKSPELLIAISELSEIFNELSETQRITLENLF